MKRRNLATVSIRAARAGGDECADASGCETMGVSIRAARAGGDAATDGPIGAAVFQSAPPARAATLRRR